MHGCVRECVDVRVSAVAEKKLVQRITNCRIDLQLSTSFNNKSFF